MKYIDTHRTVLFFVSIAVGFLSVYYLSPFIVTNKIALSIITTIFSILAGFLLAILTVVSEPSIIKSKSKRYVSAHKTEVLRLVIRHSMLFYIYIITLILIFGVSIIPDPIPEGAHYYIILVVDLIKKAMVFFTVLSFCLSFGLPKVLYDIQSRRLEQMLTEEEQF
jgi:magnesium-transporting ATPase (P-type)